VVLTACEKQERTKQFHKLFAQLPAQVQKDGEKKILVLNAGSSQPEKSFI